MSNISRAGTPPAAPPKPLHAGEADKGKRRMTEEEEQALFDSRGLSAVNSAEGRMTGEERKEGEELQEELEEEEEWGLPSASRVRRPEGALLVNEEGDDEDDDHDDEEKDELASPPPYPPFRGLEESVGPSERSERGPFSVGDKFRLAETLQKRGELPRPFISDFEKTRVPGIVSTPVHYAPQERERLPLVLSNQHNPRGKSGIVKRRPGMALSNAGEKRHSTLAVFEGTADRFAGQTVLGGNRPILPYLTTLERISMGHDDPFESPEATEYTDSSSIDRPHSQRTHLEVYFPRVHAVSHDHDRSICGYICDGSPHRFEGPTCRFCSTKIGIQKNTVRELFSSSSTGLTQEIVSYSSQNRLVLLTALGHLQVSGKCALPENERRLLVSNFQRLDKDVIEGLRRRREASYEMMRQAKAKQQEIHAVHAPAHRKRLQEIFDGAARDGVTVPPRPPILEPDRVVARVQPSSTYPTPELSDPSSKSPESRAARSSQLYIPPADLPTRPCWRPCSVKSPRNPRRPPSSSLYSHGSPEHVADLPVRSGTASPAPDTQDSMTTSSIAFAHQQAFGGSAQGAEEQNHSDNNFTSNSAIGTSASPKERRWPIAVAGALVAQAADQVSYEKRPFFPQYPIQLSSASPHLSTAAISHQTKASPAPLFFRDDTPFLESVKPEEDSSQLFDKPPIAPPSVPAEAASLSTDQSRPQARASVSPEFDDWPSSQSLKARDSIRDRNPGQNRDQQVIAEMGYSSDDSDVHLESLLSCPSPLPLSRSSPSGMVLNKDARDEDISPPVHPMETQIGRSAVVSTLPTRKKALRPNWADAKGKKAKRKARRKAQKSRKPSMELNQSADTSPVSGSIGGEAQHQLPATKKVASLSLGALNRLGGTRVFKDPTDDESEEGETSEKGGQSSQGDSRRVKAQLKPMLSNIPFPPHASSDEEQSHDTAKSASSSSESDERYGSGNSSDESDVVHVTAKPASASFERPKNKAGPTKAKQIISSSHSTASERLRQANSVRDPPSGSHVSKKDRFHGTDEKPRQTKRHSPQLRAISAEKQKTAPVKRKWEEPPPLSSPAIVRRIIGTNSSTGRDMQAAGEKGDQKAKGRKKRRITAIQSSDEEDNASKTPQDDQEQGEDSDEDLPLILFQAAQDERGGQSNVKRRLIPANKKASVFTANGDTSADTEDDSVDIAVSRKRSRPLSSARPPKSALLSQSIAEGGKTNLCDSLEGYTSTARGIRKTSSSSGLNINTPFSLSPPDTPLSYASKPVVIEVPGSPTPPPPPHEHSLHPLLHEWAYLLAAAKTATMADLRKYIRHPSKAREFVDFLVDVSGLPKLI